MGLTHVTEQLLIVAFFVCKNSKCNFLSVSNVTYFGPQIANFLQFKINANVA